MFAVGHLALGYLTGKTAAKLLNVDVNVPLLFFASILPDIDFVLGLEHRGPTHSLIVYALAFVPLFILYGKTATVYFVALSQHALLGDFATFGGVQLLWPVDTSWFGAGIRIASVVNIFLEWALFSLSLLLMVKLGDVRTLFKHHPTNLILTVPVFAIILPVFLSFPVSVPSGLLIPHAIYLGLLAASILFDLTSLLQNVKHIINRR